MKRYIPAIITTVLTVVVPAAVLHLSYFTSMTKLDMFGYGLAVCLIITSCFLYYFAQIENHLYHLTSVINDLKSQRGFLKPVSKEELYIRLGAMVKDATIRIDLMYLGEKPPHEFSASTARDKYLAILDEVVSNGNVNIRRIILCNEHTKDWIESLANKYSGNPRISLSILNDSYRGSVSVQVIDQNRIVLMNLNKSDTSLGLRDIIVSSEELSPIFEAYYQDLFNNATPLVISGRRMGFDWNKFLEPVLNFLQK